MKKVAKLVTVTLTTRIVVNEDASEETIFDVAKSIFHDKLNTELEENIVDVVDDIECPYDQDFDFFGMNELESLG